MAKNFVKGQVIEPWVDPRIVVKTSSIQGAGMFALEAIHAGETVMTWGGTIFTEDEIEAGMAKDGTASRIDDDLYLADAADQADSPDYCLNHSCDPNVWMQDEVTLVARRDISMGEELTADYAVWEADPFWEISPCGCGSATCRGKVTGKDWQLKELQVAYRGHFTPYLNQKITVLGR